MSALKYWIWLAERKGVSGRTRLALVDRFGSPEDVYFADREELLLTEGITPEEAERLGEHDLSGADRILADCQRLDVHLLAIRDAAYPQRLKNIYDPPLLLYLRGRLPAVDETLAVTVVGTRSATPYGISSAEKLGYGLGKAGAVVISGMARGADSAAIRGALLAGGSVVGVLGNGVDVVYPRENAALYDDVAAAGALVSEYPPGTAPTQVSFPARNRIMTGLSSAALVVEAPVRSGALITARLALDQGRDLFAVPGPIDAPNSAGCNRLIQQGAGLVTGAEDLLAEYADRFPAALDPDAAPPDPVLPPPPPEERPEAVPVLPSFSLSKAEAPLTDDQIALLRVLTEEPRLPDDLIEETGIPTRRVLSALTVLELDGLVAQHPGKRYSRTVTVTD